jgi:hypothetical protein
MNQRVIAISGFKRSGKDTIANYLVSEYGFKRVSFADPLKDLCASEYGVPRAAFDSNELKEKAILHLPVNPQDNFTKMICHFMFKEFRFANNSTPAEIYYKDKDNQFKGASSNRAFVDTLYHTPRSLAILKGSTNRVVSPTFWGSKAVELIRLCGIPYNVIPDLRYRSEIDNLRKEFGNNLVTVRVNRFDTVESNDPSELDLKDYDGFDFEIQNKGSVQELYREVDNLYGKIINGSDK